MQGRAAFDKTVPYQAERCNDPWVLSTRLKGCTEVERLSLSASSFSNCVSGVCTHNKRQEQTRKRGGGWGGEGGVFRG